MTNDAERAREWKEQFGEHTECPECGIDCFALFMDESREQLQRERDEANDRATDYCTKFALKSRELAAAREALREIFPYVPCSAFRAELAAKFPILKALGAGEEYDPIWGHGYVKVKRSEGK